MKVKHIVYTLLIAGIAYLIYHRISSGNQEKKQDSGPKKPMAVAGIVTQASDFENNLEVAGSIEANEQVDIRSEVPGIVMKILFTEGASVQKGQILLP